MWLPLWIWFTVVKYHACQNINGTALEFNHTAPEYKERIEDPWNYYRDRNTWWYKPIIKPKPPVDKTPDYMIDEMPPEQHKQSFYKEFERPFKLQPFTVSATIWEKYSSYDHPQLLGCYCCTVFRKVNPLSGCAVLTTRHLLTTATATELVLKDYRDEKTLSGILGAWYDISIYSSNSSVYMEPSRIHYHPNYLMPENVNASHPIPGVFDLAVWAGLYPFHFEKKEPNRQAYICNRAGSYWLQFGSPVLGAVKQPVAIIVGFQFMLWFKRTPMPFYKYAVKTQKYTGKCPKTEWGWFFCVWGRWAMLGLDSGAALHRSSQGHSWLYDGLLGMNAFSMDLRAKELTHYFTPVENHSVLTFLYDAYMGRLAYQWLDDRYVNSMWQSPYPKNGIKIEWNYNNNVPEEWYKQVDPPTFF